ncbi:hypothetical protein Sjap_006919 [Stephania japonica]|uniref:Uncharacterized protein n=1 Tax=Stephania japonica TaxID=461633 RepID=A0AAP0K6Q8_9MAGN
MVLESAPSKRIREHEDEVYLDNFHSHKRYLSEIMASSLNGLRVEDSLSENLIESPARSEFMCCLRDDISLQYSPMSEDSDDAQYGETPPNNSMGNPDSVPTSPVSPHRHAKSHNSNSHFSNPPFGCAFTAVACSHHSRPRCADSEGRLPSSPSDICHSADLRRAALMRSLQMRTQPPTQPSFELPLPMQHMEAEEEPFPSVKCLDDEPEFPNQEDVLNLFEEEDSDAVRTTTESALRKEKCRRVVDVNIDG